MGQLHGGAVQTVVARGDRFIPQLSAQPARKQQSRRSSLRLLHYWSRWKVRLVNTARVGNGDILVLPDAYWARPQVWPAVAAARRRGAYVCSIIYDVIPLQYPQLVAEGAPQSFREYLQQVAAQSDQIVAISQTVREQVRQAIGQLPLAEKPGCSFADFELGSDAPRTAGQAVRSQLTAAISSSGIDTPYLMVATFEPRKNHTYVLDAFERIWTADPSRKLCLVGGVGWLSEGLLARIQQHPRLGKQLFVFHGLNDAEVQYCYRHARAVLFASIAEGFGLPIIEALSYGRHVFASDIPIHREVGGNECTYCDLASSDDLADKLLAWDLAQPRQAPVCRVQRPPLSWQASVQQLLTRILAEFQSRMGRFTET